MINKIYFVITKNMCIFTRLDDRLIFLYKHLAVKILILDVSQEAVVCLNHCPAIDLATVGAAVRFYINYFYLRAFLNFRQDFALDARAVSHICVTDCGLGVALKAGLYYNSGGVFELRNFCICIIIHKSKSHISDIINYPYFIGSIKTHLLCRRRYDHRACNIVVKNAS